MDPKSAVIRLLMLLLVVVVCPPLRGGPEATVHKPPLVATFTPTGKQALTSALDRLARTGSFNHPDYPWVVRARAVRGDTLYFVEFLHRAANGKGFELVGKAVQVTAASSGADRLRVCLREMEIQDTEGNTLWAANRIVELPLPGRLREATFRPFSEALVHLSRDQRDALAREHRLNPEQKRVLAAFGADCYDLLLADIRLSKTGRTVVAFERKGAEVGSDGLTRFSTLAVARFDEAGKVGVCFRGNNITVETTPIMRVFAGADPEFTLRGPNGLKLVLPEVK
jgi:hypothetical protein